MLTSKQDNSLKRIEETCLTVLNSIEPLGCRFFRANQTPFINNEITSRDHHHQIKINKIYFLRADNELLKTHMIKTCMCQFTKAKKQCHSNMNVKNIVDNRAFSKKVKTLFF